MRILFDFNAMPAASNRPHLLAHPWRWWRHRLRRCPDGNLFHQTYDPPVGAIERCSISFQLLNMYEIANPPSMFVTTMLPEYTSYGMDTERTLVSGGDRTECDVVWHQCPGPDWQQLPGNSCTPGQYEMRSRSRDMAERDDNPSCALGFNSNMPTLVWPETNARTIAESVSSAVARLNDQPLSSSWFSPMLRQLALSAGVPPAQLGRPQPPTVTVRVGGDAEEQCLMIARASREYQIATRTRPTLIIMNDRDYAMLRRSLLQRPDILFGQPPDMLFGMRVQPERGMPPGQVIVANEEWLAPREWYPPPPGNRMGGLGLTFTPNPAPRRDVLPESEVIDDIDRLVNESLSVGPRDDYNVDRYPRCEHCNHSWHGILCDTCDCLGELEEEV